MTTFAYLAAFFLSFLFWLLYLWKKKIPVFLILALVFSVSFFIAAAANVRVMDQKEAAYQQEVLEKEDFEPDDLLAIHRLTVEKASAYEKETSAREKERIDSLGWNKEEKDIVESGNIHLIHDLLSNTRPVFLILDSDLFIDAASFENVAVAASYTGSYCQTNGRIEWQDICGDPVLLAAFPQNEGYSILQRKLVFSDNPDIHIMSLDYMSDSMLARVLSLPPLESVEGIYLGTYTVNGTLYYVLVNYLQGD